MQSEMAVLFQQQINTKKMQRGDANMFQEFRVRKKNKTFGSIGLEQVRNNIFFDQFRFGRFLSASAAEHYECIFLVLISTWSKFQVFESSSFERLFFLTRSQ